MKKKLRMKVLAYFFLLPFVTQSAFAGMFDDSDMSLGQASFFATLLGVAGAGITALLFRAKDDTNEIKKDYLIAANNVFFSSPGGQTLTIENYSDSFLSVNDIAILGPTEISIGDMSSCSSIAPNGSCDVTLTATANSYGSGIITITYNDTTTRTVTIGVDKTDLKLERYDTNSTSWVAVNPSDILTVEKEDALKNYKYINAGSFNWQKTSLPYVSWLIDFPPYVEIELTPITTGGSSCGEATSIGVGSYCEFTLANTASSPKPDYPGEWAILQASGKNIDSSAANIKKSVVGGGGIEIIENADTDDLHLGYRSLQVVNTAYDGTSTTSIELTGFTEINDSGGQIRLCEKGSPGCENNPTALVDECETGKVLTYGDTCLLWFKAENGAAPTENSSIISTVTVNGKTSPGGISIPEEIDKFRFSYRQSLYTGGDFGNVYRYSGAAWEAIGGDFQNALSFPGNVNALHVSEFNSDLYAGGTFRFIGTAPFKRIAKWRGESPLDNPDPPSWKLLGAGIGSSSVTDSIDSIETMGDKIYAAGNFTDTTIPGTANNIARWDVSTSTWSRLSLGTNGDIFSIVNIGDDLYVGGDFTSAGGSPFGTLAVWNETAGWKSSGVTLQILLFIFETPYALTKDDSDNLYIGTKFTTTSTFIEHNLYKFETATSTQTTLKKSPGFNILSPLGGMTMTWLDSSLYIGGQSLTTPITDTYSVYKTGTDPSDPIDPLGTPKGEVFDFASMGSTLYAAGTADFFAGNHPVGMWNGSDWLGVGAAPSTLDAYALVAAPSLVIEAHLTN